VLFYGASSSLKIWSGSLKYIAPVGSRSVPRTPWLWSYTTTSEVTAVRVLSRVNSLISPVFHAPKNAWPSLAAPSPQLSQNTIPVGAIIGGP
jgi:hypothetical protein